MKNRLAFTLVEIMIVVAILGLLIALGVPGYIKAKNLSSLNTETANMRNIQNAGAIYNINNENPNWNDAASMAAAYENINNLWPSQSNAGNPNSYIRKQLFCPSSKSAYGYFPSSSADPRKGKAVCTIHGTEDDIKTYYGF